MATNRSLLARSLLAAALIVLAAAVAMMATSGVAVSRAPLPPAERAPAWLARTARAAFVNNCDGPLESAWWGRATRQGALPLRGHVVYEASGESSAHRFYFVVLKGRFAVWKAFSPSDDSPVPGGSCLALMVDGTTHEVVTFAVGNADLDPVRAGWFRPLTID